MRKGTYQIFGTDENGVLRSYWGGPFTRPDTTREIIVAYAIRKAAELDGITLTVTTVQFEWGIN